MRFVSLQSKDVINVYDGKKIGYIADIELDWCQKCIRALIVEKMNFFHFFSTRSFKVCKAAFFLFF